ncbi:MFS transporter [Macrococcus equi]|uniref:MFS transporter n=1 Tax=Macrococcus equi TaxID=3395462 RepID=UPI0039BDE7F5
MHLLLNNNKPLQRFLAGQLIQRTSDWIDIIVLNWAILHVTHQPMALAILNMMRLLPQLLFALVTGKIVDLMRTKQLMYSVHILNIVLTIFLCISFYEQHILSIYSIIALRAYIQSIDNIQRNKVLPGFTTSDKLKQIISMNALLINVTRIIGPFIGGMLLVYFDVELLLLIPVISSLCVLILNKQLPESQLKQRNKYKIMQYLNNNKVIIHIMLTSIISMFFGFSFTIVLPIIVKHTLHQGAIVYALYTAILALGSVTVLLIFMNHNSQSSIQSLIFWAVLFTVSIALMMSQNTYIFLIAIFIMGFGSQGFRTTHRVLVQQYTQDEYKGSVLSITMMDRGFIPLGGMMMTYIYTTYGAELMYLTMLIGLIFMTLVCLYMKWEDKKDGTYIPDIK